MLSELINESQFNTLSKGFVEILKDKHTTGNFNNAINKLCVLLKADYAFLAKIDHIKNKANIVSLSVNGQPGEPFDYSLADTPCCNVANLECCIYEKDVAKKFPQDLLLSDMEIEAYVGVPVISLNSEIKKCDYILVALYKSEADKKLLDQLKSTLDLFSEIIAVEFAKDEITDRYKKKENNLNNILEYSHDLYLSINKKYEILVINSIAKQQFKRLINLDVKPGDNILKIIPKELSILWQARYDKCLKGESFIAIDAHEFNGIKFFTEVSFYPIYSNNKVSGVAVNSKDITERKIAEEKLESNKNLNQNILKSLNEGIVLQNHKAEIIYHNESACKILGLTSDQLVGKTSMDPDWRSIHEDGSEFPGIDHPVPVTLRTGKDQKNVVMGVHTPNSELRWILINSKLLKKKEKDNHPSVVASFLDITEAKNAELKLQSSEKAKEDILDAINNAAYVSTTNLKGEIIYANESLCAAHGYRTEDLIGNRHTLFSSGKHPEDFWKKMWRTISSGQTWRGEVQNKTKSGKLIWLDTVITPISNKEGEIYEYVAIRYPIDDKIKIEKQREQLSKSLSEYAHQTSHKLRSPLSTLLGITNLIIENHISKDELPTMIKYMEEKSKELDKVIHEMIDSLYLK